MKPMMLLLGLALPGWAWDFSYSATTNAAPTWNRPVEGLGSLSFIGTNVEYHIHTFVAPITGTYTITSLATGGWDNFLVLYQGTVNTAAPLLNAIAANDDFGFIGQSRIVSNMTAGTTYNIVTTGFFNSSSGGFTNTLSTPTPEPATVLLVGGGLVFCLLRRRSVTARG